jgi:hypothetical protein
MGHDAHFLERLDRVSRDQTELALGLYRDHEAVRHLLDREAIAKEASRIAISLDDPRRGPFVIVARDGHFVTCLGEGMSPGPWPVLPKTALVGSLGHSNDMRRRRKLAAQIAREDEDEYDLLDRLSKRKNRLSREEIVGISAFAPLFATSLYSVAAKRASDVTQSTLVSAHLVRGNAEWHARNVWGAAHNIELCGTVEERALRSIVDSFPDDFSFSMPLAHLSDYTFVLRGVWAAGIVGPRLVPHYFTRLEQAHSAIKSLDAALALAIIALRHESTRDEVLEYLDAYAESPPEGKISGWFGACAEAGAKMVREPTLFDEGVRATGAARYLELARASLKEGAAGYFATPEEVPSDLAETAFLNMRGSIEADPLGALAHLFAAAGLLSRCTVEAFHFPDALARTLVPAWTVEDVQFHFAQMRQATRGTPRVEYDSKISRNDPCPCGSGKKFKKCCLP